MLNYDFRSIGNRMLAFRKKAGLTQAEVAERAALSDRTYADIERGTVNMRVDTLLHICDALHITPDEVLTIADDFSAGPDDILARLNDCPPEQKATAFKLLNVYLKSL